jgi:hypothetical protein
MSKTTKNAKHLINANVFDIANKVKKFQKPKRATKANK